jgi:hypothetical protein
MITKNIATCIKGLRLLGDGKAQEARDLMKDCTAHDLREAITILEDQALWAGKLSEIGERHHASDDESIRDVLIRAAAAGDEEAKALIACTGTENVLISRKPAGSRRRVFFWARRGYHLIRQCNASAALLPLVLTPPLRPCRRGLSFHDVAKLMTLRPAAGGVVRLEGRSIPRTKRPRLAGC